MSYLASPYQARCDILHRFDSCTNAAQAEFSGHNNYAVPHCCAPARNRTWIYGLGRHCSDPLNYRGNGCSVAYLRIPLKQKM